MPKLLKRVLDRLEPWAVFLAILGILFVPAIKLICWAVLALVAFVRLARAWREAWTWFSLETMADVVGALLRVGLIVFGFLFLQRTWPWLVSNAPEARFASSYAMSGASGEVELVLHERGSDWTLEVRPPDNAPKVTGILRRHDLWVASALCFSEPVPIAEVFGLAEPVVRASVGFDRNGQPISLRIQGRTRMLLEAEAKP